MRHNNGQYSTYLKRPFSISASLNINSISFPVRNAVSHQSFATFKVMWTRKIYNTSFDSLYTQMNGSYFIVRIPVDFLGDDARSCSFLTVYGSHKSWGRFDKGQTIRSGTSRAPACRVGKPAFSYFW
jgi:hypothetical protein